MNRSLFNLFRYSAGERRLMKFYESLATNQEKIMTAISDFAAKQDAHNAKVSAALDDIKTEIGTLNTEISTLQNSPGTITPEDQATLDRLDASGTSLEAKVAALDTLTPPAPPSDTTAG